MRRRITAVVAAALSVALVGGVAYAAAPQDVPCSLDGRTLTCTMPETAAVTETVTQPPVTVTQTVTASSTTPATTTSAPTTVVPADGSWWSGQSDTITTLDGSFAAWRGRSMEIAGTWSGPADQFDAPNWQVGNKYQGQPNRAAYANVPRVDYAMVPFNSGENWGQAAAGNFDARWTSHIQSLKNAWGARDPEGMFIRFAWEWNGGWMNWSVTAGDVDHFKTAWNRFGALVRQHFPGAQITWSPNWGDNTAYDERDAYPDDQYVDVIGISMYNQWPWANTQAQLDTKWNLTGANGNPAGAESWRKYAESVGKPLALTEWANAGNPTAGGGGGDGALFFTYTNDWLKANGSQTPQPGKVLYEVLFNSPNLGDRFSVYPVATEAGNDAAAAKYAELW